MARRPSLKPQLNQIRTWVGEGVTDIWIAHQLDRTPVEIADFRRQQGLLRPGEEAPAPKRRAAKPKAAPAPKPKAAEAEAPSEDEPAKKRRRGRRGGRGRGKGKAAIAATLTHTETGVVITIDAAVLESEAYREYWAEAAAANVTVTADGIAIARAD